jgi:hypothetical protein
MFQDPKDLARAALELLSAGGENDASEERIKAAELGAAVMAYHVWSWHVAAGLEPTDLAAFKATHPHLEELRQIANGLKHAMAVVDDAPPNAAREVEWEDSAFWWAPHRRATLFLEVDGKPRSLAALVRAFAASYLNER